MQTYATVAQAAELDYTLTAGMLKRASARVRRYLRATNQPTDIPTPPDELVELVCAIAERLATIPKALAEGQQQKQQTSSQFQQGVSFGWDAWKAVTGLTAGELQALAQLYPPIPKLIVMTPVTGPYPDGQL